MHFKQLELYGFKSFAEKTVIKFEPGITAIVGPNGCGKSNISDAIRWVFGEQAPKSLRGTSMMDVIFNGTELKEPLGFAEVSLTLSNESKFLPIEYDEVTISRRLFRSGESEYLVNKTPVRLKDIQDLLAGSGLGVDSYSIVEQGKIGMILSSNPEERRYIFEEASGIIRYKAKKREAMSKLESTENNLLRVNDIITEVQRQIASIERQVKKAERYKEYFERLKELDVKQTLYTYNLYNTEMSDFQKNKEESFAREKLLNSKIAEVSGMLEELKAKLSEEDSGIFKLQSKSMDLDFSIKSNQDLINMDKERIEELGQLKSSLEEEKKSTEERIKRLSEKIEELNAQFSVISKDREQRRNMLNRDEAQLNELQKEIARNEEDIKKQKREIVDILASQSKAKNEATRVMGELQNSQARLRRLNVENQNISSELAGIEKDLREATLLADEVSAKIENYNKEKQRCEYILEKDKLEQSEIESKIRDHQNEFNSQQSKLKLLEDLLKSYEGFSSGAKALLVDIANGKLKIDGIEKPIADLIEVKRGYELAVEAALGQDVEAIVAGDREAAIRAISYLKENNLGKARFALRLSGPDDPGQIPVPDDPRAIGHLIDFVKPSAGCESVMRRLLRGVILVKDIETAMELLKSSRFDNRIRFITPKGQIVSDGIIFGGSVSEDSLTSPINRRAKIAEIKTDTEKLLAESIILKKELNEKRESITQAEEELAKIINALHREEVDLAKKNAKRIELENDFKKIKDEAGLVNLETEETSQNIKDLNLRADSLKEEIRKVEENYFSVQNLITGSQNFIDGASKRREALLINIVQLKTELTSLIKREEGLKNDLEGQNAYLKEQEEILETKRQNLSDAVAKTKELAGRIEDSRQAIEKLRVERTEIEESFSGLKKTREGVSNSIRSAEENIKSCQEAINATKERIHNLRMEETQLSFKIENLKNRIKDEYTVELDNYPIVNETREKVDWDAVNSEIAQCKEKIERLGAVSLVAIQENEELKERISFLLNQQQDLLNAKESLLRAIKKINQTTRQLFIDTFGKIQVEFRNYFRFLFNGGKADILLADENDVLESDIEIVVRPPGKKLQSISLLSGGEKALSAMALLFAIFKVNPSPFFVLDEVDAPLDDSNVGRFSKVVDDFSKQAQFIIITHNKRTISLADVMYGITMDRAGISRIVSVKFAGGKEESVLV